jgi:hypothetical protein
MTPRTIVLPGNGTQQASYQLPPLLYQYIQSVYAEVDATAAPDVRPTLAVAEASGQVIAKKRQGESIPAGDNGSATWALRLTDEGVGGAGAISTIDSPDGTIVVTNPSGPTTDLVVASIGAHITGGPGPTFLSSADTVTCTFTTTQWATPGMVNLGAFPTRIAITSPGLYVCHAQVEFDRDTVAAIYSAGFGSGVFPFFNESRTTCSNNNISDPSLSASMLMRFVAGDFVELKATRTAGTAGKQIQNAVLAVERLTA